MSLFQSLSAVSRRRRLELFNETMRPAAHMRVLDVGAEVSTEGEQGELIDVYPWKRNLSAVNILPDRVRSIQSRYAEVDARVGDARRLPWEDKSFDIVFSNAVIEHVGGPEDQRKMADEIMRVGKRWFVTTPNRWYPFEFHLRLPLVTWLPWHGYLWAGRLVQYGHVQQRYVFGVKPGGLLLLTASDLKKCFPDSRIVKQRVTFMAETLIAIGGQI